MIRRLAVIATAVGCTGALLVPAAVTAGAAPVAVALGAATDSCRPATLLPSRAITTQRDLGSGTSLTIWRDPFRTTSTYRRQLQVTAVKSDLASVGIDVRSNGFPRVTDPLKLATRAEDAKPVALINGDFFDMFRTSDGSPGGPVVQNGRILYAPFGKRSIAGEAVTTIPAAEIQKVSGTVAVGRASVPVSAINARAVPLASAVLYDRRWTAGSALPRAKTAVIIRRGVVSAITPGANVPAPTTSTVKVLLVPTSLATAVSRFRVGGSASIALTVTDGTSDKPRTIVGMAATEAQLNGSLTIGDVTVPIGALNYHYVTGSQSTAFDASWAKSTLPRSAATVVYSKGRITAVFKSGTTAAVPADSTVIQLPSQLAPVARRIRVGDEATLSMALKTDNGARFTEAIGTGSHLLRDGVVRASCSDASETDRPRTLFGWDESGHVYLMVATSGRQDTWSGFRVGGATLTEMAVWIKAMGATHAVNLDGGGSTILIAEKDAVLQRLDLPKFDAQGYATYRRPVPNAIALVPRS